MYPGAHPGFFVGYCHRWIRESGLASLSVLCNVCVYYYYLVTTTRGQPSVFDWLRSERRGRIFILYAIFGFYESLIVAAE